MMHRVLSLGAALALVLFVGAAVAADTKAAPDKSTSNSALTGTVSNIAADSITVTDKDGKDHKLTVAKDATVSCDGKKCAVADLKKGVSVTVTTMKGDATVATDIEAKSAAPRRRTSKVHTVLRTS